jgi:hypothetical protein
MDKDTKLFGTTTFSDILSDIYQNSKNKENQITRLVDQLKGLIKNINDAGMLVPLIKEYLEVAVKNDEQLVKLAAIVQRLIISAGKGSGEEFGLSEDEKQQLLREAQDLLDNTK